MVLSNQAVTKCKKNQFSLSHKSSKKYSILFYLPTLKTNNHDIKRVNTMNFLAIYLNDKSSWKEHVKYVENKIAKNIRLMYRAKQLLDKESLLALYYS